MCKLKYRHQAEKVVLNCEKEPLFQSLMLTDKRCNVRGKRSNGVKFTVLRIERNYISRNWKQVAKLVLSRQHKEAMKRVKSYSAEF